ncbi:MAG: hypothetical protein V1802_00435 [Candidatus Aenigmatarchaeota archaeon]
MNKPYHVFLYIVLLSALVLVSACIGGTNVSPDIGLSIREFSVDPKTVEADDTVRFFLDAENVGGTTAKCVTSELFGIEDWRDADGNPLSVFGTFTPRGISFIFRDGSIEFCYWDYSKARQICIGYNKESGVSLDGFIGNSFFQFSNTFCNSLPADLQPAKIRFNPELTPPVPQRNTPGETFTPEWVLRPPVISEGLKQSYRVTARTSFFYTTNAKLNIETFSKAEYKRKQDLGEQIMFPLDVVNSYAAPISVYVSNGASPIIVNPDPNLGQVQTQNYIFEFRNVGSGFPLPFKGDVPGASGPETESGFILTTMKITGPGATFYDCLGQQGNEIFIPPSGLISNLVKIRGDNKARFGCQVAIDRSQWIDNPMGIISIEFNLFYRYYVDAETTVDVIGVEGLSR